MVYSVHSHGDAFLIECTVSFSSVCMYCLKFKHAAVCLTEFKAGRLHHKFCFEIVMTKMSASVFTNSSMGECPKEKWMLMSLK